MCCVFVVWMCCSLCICCLFLVSGLTRFGWHWVLTLVPTNRSNLAIVTMSAAWVQKKAGERLSGIIGDQWNLSGSGQVVGSVQNCPFLPFLELSLHVQRLDDIDNCGGYIEEQEVAQVQTWHTKQGVYRKKILPDVRDDLMGDPTGEL